MDFTTMISMVIDVLLILWILWIWVPDSNHENLDKLKQTNKGKPNENER